MMWWYTLHQMMSHLDHSIALHVAMMHQWRFKELRTYPQNQHLKLRIYLSDRFDLRDHSGERL
jgi:hypothetical protein